MMFFQRVLDPYIKCPRPMIVNFIYFSFFKNNTIVHGSSDHPMV